jgi:hypothetical protein
VIDYDHMTMQTQRVLIGCMMLTEGPHLAPPHRDRLFGLGSFQADVNLIARGSVGVNDTSAVQSMRAPRRRPLM